MRTSSRAQALAVPLLSLAVLLGAARAPAQARRLPGAGGRCRIELAPAAPVPGGQPVTLSGALECASSAAAEAQTLTVEQHVAGAPGFTAVGTVTTGAGGSFSFTTPEGLAADSVFSVRAPGARSARRAVRALAAVTLAGPAAGSRLAPAARRAFGGAGEDIVLSGSVSASGAGAVVVLQRESQTASGDWRRIAVGTVGADGRYSIAHRFGSPGTVTLRAVLRAGGMRAAASPTLSYEVEPRQNRELTLQSSAMTAEYGAQVTLSGVAALDRRAPLQLLARTREGSFRVVATTTSGPAGEYSFSAQALQSTLFRVRGARALSAALPEAVRPLLSLTAPSSAAPSGGAISFCGTVSPAYPGERIYLQRQVPGGLAFHTVSEEVLGTAAAASAAGSFCLHTTAGAAGSEVFRVKVPRGGGEQAAASEPLDVQVAPAAQPSAPAEALEAPPAEAPPAEVSPAEAPPREAAGG